MRVGMGWSGVDSINFDFLDFPEMGWMEQPGG